jgi:hypothetical protein
VLIEILAACGNGSNISDERQHHGWVLAAHRACGAMRCLADIRTFSVMMRIAHPEAMALPPNG